MLYSGKNIMKMNSGALLRAEQKCRAAAIKYLNSPYFGMDSVSLLNFDDEIDNLVRITMERRKREIHA